MPGYLAKVLGENFQFEFDDDIQSMNFSRTIYVDAENETGAETGALDIVQQQLRSHALWNEHGTQQVLVEQLEPFDESATLVIDHDFFWYFAE